MPTNYPLADLRRSLRQQHVTAEQTDHLHATAANLRNEVDLIMKDSVRGPRGERTSLTEALEQEDALRQKVDVAVSLGDRRHDRANPWQSRSIKAAPVLDFPLFLWFASSVFNVPWQSNPLGVQLVVSITVAIFATLVLAVALHNIGSGLRPFKTEQRELRWQPLPTSARIRLICTVILLCLVGVVMFARIYIEADASGAGGAVAAALALFVAALAVVANALVAWVPFCDGSTDTDNLDHYAAVTVPQLARCMDMLRSAADYDIKAAQLDLMNERYKTRAETDASLPGGAAQIIGLRYPLDSQLQALTDPSNPNARSQRPALTGTDETPSFPRPSSTTEPTADPEETQLPNKASS